MSDVKLLIISWDWSNRLSTVIKEIVTISEIGLFDSVELNVLFRKKRQMVNNNIYCLQRDVLLYLGIIFSLRIVKALWDCFVIKMYFILIFFIWIELYWNSLF